MENTQDLSACVTKLQENVLQWENRLQSEQGGPAAFRLAMNELRAALDEIGRTGFLRLAHACEVASDTLGNDGRLYRFKQMVDKEWMSLWGKVVVPRRLYQEDHGGPSRVPLDERCGMVNRFMVPELERVTAFLGARLVPAEVEDSLGEVLPEPPSRTAIQHVLTTVGQCAEDGAEQLELALQGAAPLDAEGDTLVVSWDGVTVPLREPAPKRGRPARATDGHGHRHRAHRLEGGGCGHGRHLPDAAGSRGRRAGTSRCALCRAYAGSEDDDPGQRPGGADGPGVAAGWLRPSCRFGRRQTRDLAHRRRAWCVRGFHPHSGLLSRGAASVDGGGAPFRQKVGEGGSLVSILAAQTAPYTQRRGGLDPLPFLPPSQTPKTIGPLSPGDHRNGLLSQQPGQDGIRWLSRLGLDHLQWPCGGRRQDHRRPPTQTQRHAMDPPRRSADPQPTSPGAIETMGCFLELVSPADHAHNNPEKGSVKTRLHPLLCVG